MGLLI